MSIVEVRPEDPTSDIAATLIAAVMRELEIIYNLETKLGGFKPEDAQQGGAFVVAWRGGEAIGCGALRPLAPGVGEVKRMYVRPEARGLRVGEAILQGLEREARALGMHTLRLEMGDRQPAATQLYERVGFVRIPCFPPYDTRAWSRCYEKRVPEPDTRDSGAPTQPPPPPTRTT